MKQKHPNLRILKRKKDEGYLYGFYANTQEEGLYLLLNRPNFVYKEKHNKGHIYFFDLDNDAK